MSRFWSWCGVGGGTDEALRHEATPAIWQEVYLSAILRAILYADDANYVSSAWRRDAAKGRNEGANAVDLRSDWLDSGSSTLSPRWTPSYDLLRQQKRHSSRVSFRLELSER